MKSIVAAMLVILGISFLMSFNLALRVVLVVQLVISVILSSIFSILAIYTSFLTKSFLLCHLAYLNQQEQALIYKLLFIYFTFQID